MYNRNNRSNGWFFVGKSVGDEQLYVIVIFTEDSFRPDYPDEQDTRREWEYRDAFTENRYETLFRLGFDATDSAESLTFAFLHTVAGHFLKALTTLPDLEVARD